HVQSSGSIDPGWIANGAVVSGLASGDIEAISDGAGGVIATLGVDGDSLQDILVGRLDASGALPPGWPGYGVDVCRTRNVQAFPRIVPDGTTHGAIIAWEDLRNGTDYDVYAARVDPAGKLLSVPMGPPERFSMRGPLPNPTRAVATVGFELPRSERV